MQLISRADILYGIIKRDNIDIHFFSYEKWYKVQGGYHMKISVARWNVVDLKITYGWGVRTSPCWGLNMTPVVIDIAPSWSIYVTTEVFALSSNEPVMFGKYLQAGILEMEIAFENIRYDRITSSRKIWTNPNTTDTRSQPTRFVSMLSRSLKHTPTILKPLQNIKKFANERSDPICTNPFLYPTFKLLCTKKTRRIYLRVVLSNHNNST